MCVFESESPYDTLDVLKFTVWTMYSLSAGTEGVRHHYLSSFEVKLTGWKCQKLISFEPAQSLKGKSLAVLQASPH